MKLRNKMSESGIDALWIESPFNRRYLTGFTGTAGYVLVTRDEAFFLTDFRYRDQAEEQVQDFDVVIHQGVAEKLSQILPSSVKKLGFEKQHLTFGLLEQYQAKVNQVEWVPVESWVEALRAVKDEAELDVMRQAAEIADQAFQHILNYLRPGISEREAAIELEFFMRKRGATAASFETIIASGPRSALPHGVAGLRVLQAGDLVTLDFGALFQGYCSDLTRTVALGEANQKQREIYAIVLEAQENGVSHIKAGMTCKQADALTRDIITEYGYGEYFGHGTGHGLGLEVHEGPALSFRSEEELKPGMVVTIEPGIYLPDFGGVRIEDDVLINDDGIEILTHSPKKLIVL
jgi:Xaa-Pro aminopeptidase